MCVLIAYLESRVLEYLIWGGIEIENCNNCFHKAIGMISIEAVGSDDEILIANSRHVKYAELLKKKERKFRHRHLCCYFKTRKPSQ